MTRITTQLSHAHSWKTIHTQRATIVEKVLTLPDQPAQPKSRNCEFAGQNDHQRPGGHERPLAEDAHCGDDQQLVRQRVKELAEVGDLVVVPGDVAVHKVGQACHDKESEGQKLEPGVGRAQKQSRHERGDHHHTHDRDFTCSCHVQSASLPMNSPSSAPRITT